MKHETGNITKEKANLILKEFSDKGGMVSFCHYYKFDFSFQGELEDIEIHIGFGGNRDDIYREEVTNKPFKLQETDVDKLMGRYYNSLIIKRGDKSFLVFSYE